MKYQFLTGVYFLMSLCMVYPAHTVTEEDEVRRLGSRAEAMRYNFPAPPAGTWVAIYSQDFAEKFNLPNSGVRHNLEGFVQYLEIVSLNNSSEYIKRQKAKGMWEYPDESCYVNMVMSKDNDISLAGQSLNKDQKERINFYFRDLDQPLVLVKRDKMLATYRSVNFGSYGGIHSGNLVDGYDYFSVKPDLGCRSLVTMYKNKQDLKLSEIPRISAFDTYVLDTSVRQQKSDKSNPEWYRTITIPYSLLAAFYQGIHVPPPFDGQDLSARDMVKVIPALPALFAMMFDSAGSSGRDKAIGYFPPPEGPETHFHLEKVESK